VVPENFTLSDKNIAEVQARMPNRHGMTTQHAMWPGNEFKGSKVPDVKNTACMKDCAPEPKVASFLPDFARNAHGNLAEQNRPVGAQRGADTTRPEGKLPGASGTSGAAAPAAAVVAQALAAPKVADAPKAAGGMDGKAAMLLTQKYSCTACHAMDKKTIGPSFADIAKKYPDKTDYLVGKIKAGGAGIWGAIPLPAQSLGDADAKVIAAWLASGAAK
ncbi:MAG: cytochrome C, partial [Polaromonas sp.]|nr:cytochrome C [Polaromonas sp.]